MTTSSSISNASFIGSRIKSVNMDWTAVVSPEMSLKSMASLLISSEPTNSLTLFVSVSISLEYFESIIEAISETVVLSSKPLSLNRSRAFENARPVGELSFWISAWSEVNSSWSMVDSVIMKSLILIARSRGDARKSCACNSWYAASTSRANITSEDRMWVMDSVVSIWSFPLSNAMSNASINSVSVDCPDSNGAKKVN